MKINGNYTLNTTPDIFWEMVMDPKILEKTTPGIKELNEIAPDSYEAISQVRVGPVKGNFNGKLSIKDKVEAESCTLVVDQKSKMGNVIAEIGMNFKSVDDNNMEVAYTGEAKMSGTLATMGQRIMSGVVSTLSKQFFKNMEKQIAARSTHL